MLPDNLLHDLKIVKPISHTKKRVARPKNGMPTIEQNISNAEGKRGNRATNSLITTWAKPKDAYPAGTSSATSLIIVAGVLFCSGTGRLNEPVSIFTR